MVYITLTRDVCYCSPCKARAILILQANLIGQKVLSPNSRIIQTLS